VLRDRTLHRLVELGRRELTIGRGEQNDVVLPDPEKIVSRFHAELRPEGAGYVLIDLNSQNGTWVDARRVDRVSMRAGVPVAIGPYQLILEEGTGTG
jgi:pSer/pThr/pTyr-binding forkhead associated (FHA) protein